MENQIVKPFCVKQLVKSFYYPVTHTQHTPQLKHVICLLSLELVRLPPYAFSSIDQSVLTISTSPRETYLCFVTDIPFLPKGLVFLPDHGTHLYIRTPKLRFPFASKWLTLIMLAQRVVTCPRICLPCCQYCTKFNS